MSNSSSLTTDVTQTLNNQQIPIRSDQELENRTRTVNSGLQQIPINNELLDQNMRQSKRSHTEGDGAIKRGLKRFFGKMDEQVGIADKLWQDDNEFTDRLEADLADQTVTKNRDILELFLRLKRDERKARDGDEKDLSILLDEMRLKSRELAVRTEEENVMTEEEKAEIVRKLDYYIGYFRGTMSVSEDIAHPSQPCLPAMKIDATKTGVPLNKKIRNSKAMKIVVSGKYKDSMLFSSTPAMQDAQQGVAGDCYFIASVASVMQNDPQLIRKMMRDNGDNTVTVRFFRERKMREYYERQNQEEVQQIETEINGNAEAFKTMLPAARLEFLLRKACLDPSPGNKVRFLFQTIPSQWYKIKYNGMSLCELLMDESFYKQQTALGATNRDIYLNLGVFRNLAGKENDIDGSLKDLNGLDDSIINLFTGFVWLIYNQIKSNNNNQVDLFKEDQAPLIQEVYVTVTKDLPEWVKAHDARGNVTKTSPIYARGPLWMRLLEKAYAASGLNPEANKDYKLDESDRRGYEGIEGGQMHNTFLHLTGQMSSSFEMPDFESNNNDVLSRNTLLYAVCNHFGEGWKQKIKDELQDYSDNDINALEKALEQEDESRLIDGIEKDAHGQPVLVNGQPKKVKYRKQAVGLDDLIRVILSTKIGELDGNAGGEERRKRLAQWLTGRMAESDECRLQYARFSGHYTKAARETLDKIRNSLAQKRPLGAASRIFIPQSVNSTGLNGEAVNGGIVEGHAYSVMGTKTQGNIEFIKLRNPWAHGVNIYRKKGDGTVTSEMENSSVDNDGEFLVELNDFMRRFDRVYGI